MASRVGWVPRFPRSRPGCRHWHFRNRIATTSAHQPMRANAATFSHLDGAPLMTWNTFVRWLRRHVALLTGLLPARNAVPRRRPYIPQIDCILEERIVPTGTIVNLSLSAAELTYGQAVSASASVVADDGSTPPEGVTIFCDGFAWNGGPLNVG